MKAYQLAAIALGLVPTSQAFAISNPESSTNVPPVAVILERALEQAKREDAQEEWDPLESTCRHASLSIL